MVTAGATANTTEGNSRASRESGLLCSHSHGQSIDVHLRHTSTRAYTRAQACGATPELRRVADRHRTVRLRHSSKYCVMCYCFAEPYVNVICMYVKIRRTSTRAYTRAQARGATPGLRRDISINRDISIRRASPLPRPLIAPPTPIHPSSIRSLAARVEAFSPANLCQFVMRRVRCPLWQCRDRLLLARVWLCADL